MRIWRRVAAALVMACAAAAAAREGARVSLEAKDLGLAETLERLAEGGGPRLTADPGAADVKVTFAVQQASAGEAVRWLCRACRLAVVKREDGLVVGHPATDEARLREYKIARVAPTQTRADALVTFLRRVVLGAYQNRAENEAGELEPQLEIASQDGKLRVLAPPMVHREVLAVLRTMVQAAKPMDYQQLRVPYKAYELGFLGARGTVPPAVRGQVSLTLDDVPAPEACWELTVASEQASFFVDPWDEALAKRRVSLEAKGLAAGVAAKRLAEQLGVERVFYDGATVFVTAARKPMFESLVVRVYNVSGSVLGRSIAEQAERVAKDIKLPPNLPYAVEMVGTQMLAAAPGPMHRRFEELMELADRLDGLPGGGRLPEGIRWPRR